MRTGSVLMKRLEKSIGQLDSWLVIHEDKAFDPFDGLNSWLRPLAFGKIGRQTLLQIVKRCGWNLRPLLGIRPAASSKGMGYLARGYLSLYRLTRDQKWLNRARHCLTWLRENPSSDFSYLCWGNHFDYQSRVFWLTEGTPSVVWTALIGHAFLDAWEALQDNSYLDSARSVCQFIVEDLERRKEGLGECISYIPQEYHPIHNANMLAAAVLARTGKHTEEESLQAIAAQAVAYTVGAQRPDGSWWYGEQEKLHWVDNFHTGYILDSLFHYIESTGDNAFKENFLRGAHYYVKNFFSGDGIPKFYPHRVYPVDIQCVAQSLESLSILSNTYDRSCLRIAEKVAVWALSHMQDPSGYFYYQRTAWRVNRTPMLHWGQATMLAGLSALLCAETGLDSSSESRPPTPFQRKGPKNSNAD